MRISSIGFIAHCLTLLLKRTRMSFFIDKNTQQGIHTNAFHKIKITS